MFYASACNIGPHFPNWLQTQTNLQNLDLSNSSIRDTIPEWFENILSHIVDLDLSNNQIGGKLPLFHVDSNNRRRDLILNMNLNKFTSRIPLQLCQLSALQYLSLAHNNITGTIPSCFGNLSATWTCRSTTYLAQFQWEINSRLLRMPLFIKGCGPPISRSCKGNYTHVGEDEGQVDNEASWFYNGIGSGFVVGFMGLVGSLYFIRNWT
ncbi:hypothetical protein L1987_29838 [Smallanthus sonchifolius]|uniref:Uncharacterized protein n=1 Tax=Smallanthus sonchifolius TaxID=185202 RepID=A0ACB9I2X1_9ASTR|nr:hypothetical protein L1987_29838 [Smallanthus sonchifolius]